MNTSFLNMFKGLFRLCSEISWINGKNEANAKQLILLWMKRNEFDCESKYWIRITTVVYYGKWRLQILTVRDHDHHFLDIRPWPFMKYWFFFFFGQTMKYWLWEHFQCKIHNNECYFSPNMVIINCVTSKTYRYLFVG